MKLSVFSTLGEDVTKYEVTNPQGELALYVFNQEPDGKVIPKYNTDDEFFRQLFKDGSYSDYMFNKLAQSNYKQHTLLAYILEAARTTEGRAALLIYLFTQIAEIYTSHPDLAKQIKLYFQDVKQKNNFGEIGRIESLFQTSEKAHERLKELVEKLQTKQKLSKTDFNDMGIFALPFNLKYITDRMVYAYRVHSATETPLNEQNPA